ncbi:hypothetical protein EMA8858_03825 [Emticicia aquatica]|uniref:N-acetylmuramidase domain-containing protein n=1 Tax=Emticicia aquatica TaxID=1681835 RepID=A0ABN8EY29_9BACT|nr:N-acetylmuramidase family protein [Emticicia aquatica]CAH0997691.1 hypothetical protein EMA8858_03825 [Emticicia aquatica]
MAITSIQFDNAAKRLGVEIAAIKSVARVESVQGGFDSAGKLTILFEPHIFWKNLLKVGIDPKPLKLKYPDLLNPVWDKTLYGPSKNQWNKLILARTIDKQAANLSASYGAFQIMGFNYSQCGFADVEAFINYLNISESNQLDAFCSYLFSVHLVDELKHLDWSGFARGYNGPFYWQNKYDIKLKQFYDFYKANPDK